MSFSNTSDLQVEAQSLADLARKLIGIRREATHRRTEKPANSLGHATIRFSIALDHLATAGAAAADAMESRFAPVRPPGDELAVERAELALLSAIFAGDFALDAFAWAELSRRSRRLRLKHEKDGRVPVPWATFMDTLDGELRNPMTSRARYLDVTLDAARDALGAHRDPELELMTGSGTGGWFTVQLVSLSPARIRYALRCLDEIELAVPVTGYFVPTSPHSEYSSRVDALVAASSLLNKHGRRKLRAAYRWAGFESPSLTAIARQFGILVRLYLEHRRVEIDDLDQ